MIIAEKGSLWKMANGIIMKKRGVENDKNKQYKKFKGEFKIAKLKQVEWEVSAEWNCNASEND